MTATPCPTTVVSPTCHAEPNCSSATGTCTRSAGTDWSSTEGCDDGNTNNGDGCSSTCTVEPGYQCAQPDSTAATMTVPVTYRDFLLGGDFYAATISGSNLAVDRPGSGHARQRRQTGPLADRAGYRAHHQCGQLQPVVPGHEGDQHHLRFETPSAHNGNGGFVNWWKENQQWMSYFQYSLVFGRNVRQLQRSAVRQ